MIPITFFGTNRVNGREFRGEGAVKREESNLVVTGRAKRVAGLFYWVILMTVFITVFGIVLKFIAAPQFGSGDEFIFVNVFMLALCFFSAYFSSIGFAKHVLQESALEKILIQNVRLIKAGEDHTEGSGDDLIHNKHIRISITNSPDINIICLRSDSQTLLNLV